MALKQVVVDAFFDAMIRVLREIEEERGPIAFAMLESAYKSGPTKWSLWIAAPWLGELDLKEATMWMSARVRRGLGSLAEKYGSTRIKRTDDYLVKELTPMLDIPELGNAYGLRSAELELFNLNESAVLVANPALIARAPETMPA